LHDAALPSVMAKAITLGLAALDRASDQAV
jgi:hypothetical protein